METSHYGDLEISLKIMNLVLGLYYGLAIKESNWPMRLWLDYGWIMVQQVGLWFTALQFVRDFLSSTPDVKSIRTMFKIYVYMNLTSKKNN